MSSSEVRFPSILRDEFCGEDSYWSSAVSESKYGVEEGAGKGMPHQWREEDAEAFARRRGKIAYIEDRNKRGEPLGVSVGAE